MSILIPVVSTGITLNEVPDKVAFYVELGECTQHCAGCHSPHLWEPVAHKTTLEDLQAQADEAIDKGANAIVLMGGTTNGLSMDDLIKVIDGLEVIAQTCLYSGIDDMEVNRYIAEHSHLTWIKTGSYKDELGGITSPTSNQRFFRKEYEYRIENFTYPKVTSVLVDCTHLFRV